MRSKSVSVCNDQVKISATMKITAQVLDYA